MTEPLLTVEGIETAYGRSQVLHGMSLTVGEGEAVTLLGRNGMGKTTTIRSIMGLTPAAGGVIRFRGQDIRALPPYRTARLGLGLVPEGRRVFPNLTVRENLIATASGGTAGGKSPWTLDRVLQQFPRLSERAGNMGNELSGGEQQMLAIARALMTNPQLLILDEATEGLAPLIREEIWACLRSLKYAGQSILVIDKDVRALSRFADRHYIIEKGRCVWNGNSGDLVADDGLQARFLGV